MIRPLARGDKDGGHLTAWPRLAMLPAMITPNDDNPLSYWLATTPAFDADAPLPDRAQVVVVGGGVFGACVTLHLARAGADVLLVERGDLASGATGRNAGILSPGTTEDYGATREQLGADAARAVWAFTEDGAAGLRALLTDEGIDADFRAEGSYTAALSAEGGAAQRATVEQLARDGFGLDWLDRDALQARVGVPLAPAWRGARFNPRGGVLHSGKLVRGLAQAAVRRGAQVAQDVAVADVRGGMVRTDHGDIQADEVVLTTNAYTGRVYPGLAGVIEPVRGQIRATVPLAERAFPGAWSANAGGEYWQQTADGAWVLGGMRRVAADAERGYTSNAVRQEVQRALDDFVAAHFPALVDAPVAYRWGGVMGFTPDSNPLIGPLERGLWVAAGCTGHGMPFAAEAGRQMALWLCGGSPDRDMSPFDPARFG